nr:lysophospholipid acyltransferase family protein [Candidatus Sigynarchaeota archaeon]
MFRPILKGLLNATMFDMAVSVGRNLLDNYNLLENGEDAFYWTYHPAVRALFNTYFKLTVKGEENVPMKGPLVFCPNHSSFLDPIVVSAATTFHQIHWIGKFEHFVEDPIVKSIFSMWSAIPIHRGQSDQVALQKAIDHMNAGHCIGIFPEGTRSLDGNIGKLHNGAAKLAVTAGATIIPVGMVGMIKALKKGEMLPKSVTVTLEYGKPVYTYDIKGQEENWEVVKEVTAKIESELKRIIGDRNRI